MSIKELLSYFQGQGVRCNVIHGEDSTQTLRLRKSDRGVSLSLYDWHNYPPHKKQECVKILSEELGL